MLPSRTVAILSPEAIAAASRSADKLSLQNLQSKMKCDPESYEAELELIYKQFESSLELFQQQAALSFTSLSGIGADPTVAKDLGERAMFLAHMTQFYPKHLSDFPKQLADLLRTTAKSLPSSLRCQIAQAVILLINRKILAIGEMLALFMELQTLGDRMLKKLAYSHVVRFIQQMNKKHKDEAKNKPLQNVLFQMLQREEESIAKRSLVTLCDLHRRKVWSDDRTVNAICMACFHPSSRIMIAALSFLLDFEKIQDDDDSDASSSEDEATTPQPHVVLSREEVYKVTCALLYGGVLLDEQSLYNPGHLA
uniref:Protein SDA1 n=1 Tax=Opuntia streptacantha TaxID=393608 RepID=A0A7C9E610_OPUST